MAMNSSINDKNIEEEEESGWTQYLEDFSCNRDSFISSSSMVSDAAWNGSSDTIKQLNLKKLNRRRKNTYEYDDALEDTASSPVHSPKVSTMMKQMEVNHRKMDEGQQSNSKNFLKPEREERNTKNIVIDNETSDQYMELRKRGLCLVPMSALINYIG
ncbi:vascular-related unknown protein 1-like isoform X1 [Salvia splendens]|uniref:vascular-related unknown protein 1-like isoform X1 n=1 Tax=Salvia splendens TaxID=180675 RepID=UPI001C262DD5|nr:vascular-related unknown protein 1-like isoform X1 [Salvia splendens]